MSDHIHLDYESFSMIDLADVGAYRYAYDPSTEILCAAMAINNEEPVVWYPGTEQNLERYWDALENPEVTIYAHNAQFEMAISQALMWKTWGIRCPDLSRFRCTMSLARRAALPAKLETLGEVLKIKNQKDKKGKSLIRKFSMMQPPKKPTKKHPNGLPAHRILPTDEPEAFQEFMDYCAQDVRAEQEIATLLSYFDEPINNANYSLDARINARGVPVNLEALRHAQKLIEEETEIVSRQFRELTGFEVTQGARFLEWLKNNYADLDNLQAETIENFLEENPLCPKCGGKGETGTDEDIEVEGFLSCPTCGGTSDTRPILALRMKQSVAYASIKKVATMLACAGPHDNRIRGMLGHHQATTGRWGNNIVQFQNMKRPTIKNSEDAYRDICDGISREMLDLVYGAPLEVISSCIRHFVQDV